MNNLIKANFLRLKKDKLFYVLIAFILGFGLYSTVVPMINIENLPADYTFEDVYFFFAPIMCAIIAVFSSMFFGTEHSDGALRNKIIAGQTRTKIYLANFISNIIVSTFFTVLFLALGMIAYSTFGGFTLSFGTLANYILIILFSNTVFCALFTFIAMLCQNKTFILLISLAVLVFIVTFSNYLYSAINEPEFSQSMVLITEGDGAPYLSNEDPEPNPHYISGTQRTIYENLFTASAFGHVMKVSWVEISTNAEAIAMLVFSTLNTIILTALGLFLFNKLDLK